ncbi:MAG: MarR family transcriptional regulator [Bifidobacteriaceae bacterium]|jgi:DNA-binding MarR family transcriptional regulator|nr:MarR family transcriptional regulator [Bifidobacteriaceae bacterium]
MDLARAVEGVGARKIVLGGLFATANRLQRVLDGQLPELTARQWWVLVMLEIFDAPPTLTQLAEVMDTSHQSLKGLVGHLASKGFVEVGVDPSDARALRVIPTAKVGEWSKATAGQSERFMDAMFAGIDGERLALVGEALMDIHAALGGIERQGGRP